MKAMVALLVTAALFAPLTAGALQETPDLAIDVETDEGGAWYTNPLWITIGVIILLLIVLLIVALGRGGGTTVIRD